MPRSGKKNRFSDCIGQNFPPGQDKLSNPSKKSRTEDDNSKNISNDEANSVSTDGNPAHSV